MLRFFSLVIIICCFSSVFAQNTENLDINDRKTLDSLLHNMRGLYDINRDDRVVVIYAKTLFDLREHLYLPQSYSLDGLDFTCERGAREAQAEPKKGEGVLYEGEFYKSDGGSNLTLLCMGELFARAFSIASEPDIQPIITERNWKTKKVVNLKIGQAYKFHMSTVFCLPGKPGVNQKSNDTFDLRKNSKYIVNGSSQVKVLFKDEVIQYHDEHAPAFGVYVKATCCE